MKKHKNRHKSKKQSVPKQAAAQISIPKTPSGERFTPECLISTLACLMPLIFTAVIYEQLPAQIGIHFDASGQPDQFASRLFVALIEPLLIALANLVVHVSLVGHADSKNSAKVLLSIAKWLLPLIALLLVPITLLLAIGQEPGTASLVMVAVGIGCTVFGSYLPSRNQRDTLAFKLPWTMADENNWTKTHKVAGLLWILGGSIITVCTYLGVPIGVTIALGLIVLIGFPCIYSRSIAASAE